MKKITWTQLITKLKPDWHLGKYSKQKTLLSFEFGIVLSNVAHDLRIEVTQEMVQKAEYLLSQELQHSAESFASQMNGFILAILEPKE